MCPYMCGCLLACVVVYVELRTACSCMCDSKFLCMTVGFSVTIYVCVDVCTYDSLLACMTVRDCVFLLVCHYVLVSDSMILCLTA